MDPPKSEALSSPLSSSPLSLSASPLPQPADAAFLIAQIDPSSKQSNELLQLRIKELEKELYRRRISMNIQAESSNGDTLGRSCSDCLQGKDVETMRLQVELAGIKVTRDRKEAEYTRERNAQKDENTRLRGQLEALQTDATRLSQDLAQSTALANLHIATIETLTQDKETLSRKVAVLEDEVYSEKEHSSEVQRSTSDALKQLLASKALCESDLEELKEQHMRCITNSSKVEQNLRAQVAEVMAECRQLREKQPVPLECAELGVILDSKNSEIATLQATASTLEDKLLNISAQLAQERAQHFATQNLLYQDNATLRSENEALKQREAADTYTAEALKHQIQLNEALLQREKELKARVSELQESIGKRDGELHRRQRETEEQKMRVRTLEDQLEAAQSRLEGKLEAQKSAETQYICELTKEKLETEKAYFAEVANRAKVEDRLYSQEKHQKQLEAKYKALWNAANSCPRVQRLSFQADQSPFRQFLRPSEPLFPLEETKEQALTSAEVGVLSSLPGRMPDSSHPVAKEACTNFPCNCLLS